MCARGLHCFQGSTASWNICLQSLIIRALHAVLTITASNFCAWKRERKCIKHKSVFVQIESGSVLWFCRIWTNVSLYRISVTHGLECCVGRLDLVVCSVWIQQISCAVIKACRGLQTLFSWIDLPRLLIVSKEGWRRLLSTVPIKIKDGCGRLDQGLHSWYDWPRVLTFCRVLYQYSWERKKFLE